MKLNHPIISSIGEECPLHFKDEPTQLNDSIVSYAQYFTDNHLVNNDKKVTNLKRKNSTFKNKSLNKKKKLTISEIFLNSNIIIQNEIGTSPLNGIKSEIFENCEQIIQVNEPV